MVVKEAFKIFMYISVIYGVTADYAFRNISLPWKERVDDLVSRLSAEEIMYQMARGGGGFDGPAPPIKRLGIGPYAWATECLRGDVGAGTATAFPQAIGLAATFSPRLMYKVAEATGVEVRAKNTDFVRRGIFTDHSGLSCFSPVINIMRHPLWGRNQETYGEDPFLSGIYAANFVKGLQGDHPRYIRANAGCKHFNVHGGPENVPASRFSFNSVVSDRDWRLTFLPAFRKCVEAGTYSLMCSYNSINGVPACANSKLLTSILREEWNFTGYVVSDMSALESTMTMHHYFNSSVQVAAGCVKAGCNLELCPVNDKKPSYLYILDAIKENLMTEETIREKVKPLFYTRMRLGEFDPPSMNPYMKLNLSVVESEAHRKLAVEAAAKSIVMLKGQQSVIPFFKQIPKIAFVGPMANNSADQNGDYPPDPDPRYVTNPYESLKSWAVDSSLAAGCEDGTKCEHYNSSGIQEAVKDAWVIFVCLGTGTEIEREGNDRRNMELPGKQLQLLQDAVKYGGDVSVILLVFSAGPVNITWAEENKNIVNIFQCFFPSQATGDALLALFSSPNGISPAGRLPYTWYKYADQIPSMVDYNMKERTYRYFTGEPLYPFGYGLSYTTFNYSDFVVPKTVKAGENVTIQVTVTNMGLFDGDEVVQVYISWLTTKEVMPNLQLVAFDRVFVAKKSSITVKLTIEGHSLAVWTDKGFLIEQGSIKVYIGGQLPNQKKTIPSNVLSTQFKIINSRYST